VSPAELTVRDELRYLLIGENLIIFSLEARFRCWFTKTASRVWAAPMVSGLTEDYALIARAIEPETGQMMPVIAGLSEKGSAAALEFVTNPKYLDRFASQAPAGWERRNIELVIKSNLVNDEWGEPRVVAMHFW
jgi:hypothetical protein